MASFCATARHGTARHGTARHGTARHGTARHGTARHGTARHGTARHGGWPVSTIDKKVYKAQKVFVCNQTVKYFQNLQYTLLPHSTIYASNHTRITIRTKNADAPSNRIIVCSANPNLPISLYSMYERAPSDLGFLLITRCRNKRPKSTSQNASSFNGDTFLMIGQCLNSVEYITMHH